jgi:hypothetical protein
MRWRRTDGLTSPKSKAEQDPTQDGNTTLYVCSNTGSYLKEALAHPTTTKDDHKGQPTSTKVPGQTSSTSERPDIEHREDIETSETTIEVTA